MPKLTIRHTADPLSTVVLLDGKPVQNDIDLLSFTIDAEGDYPKASATLRFPALDLDVEADAEVEGVDK